MNTAVTIALIICATLIFFAALGFLSGRESREIQKKELDIRETEIVTKQMEVVSKLPNGLQDMIFKEIGKQ